MENRRATRSAPETVKQRRTLLRTSPIRKSPTRRSPARKSPTRRSPARKSPTRRSPARKSPARRSPPRKSPTRRSPGRRTLIRISPPRTSPIRKSPARKSPARKSPARKSPARKFLEKSPVRKRSLSASRRGRAPTKLTTLQNKEAVDKILKNKVKVSLLSRNTTKLPQNSVETSKSTITTLSTKIKVGNISNEHDDEIAKITSGYSQAARMKLDMMSHNLTPTPSEKSAHSMSRSISRSFVDDDDNHSNSEYSDHEKEPLYESVDSDKKYKYESRQEGRIGAKQPVLQEFWGSIGAFCFITLLSSLGFYLQYACTKESCGFNIEQLEKLKSIGTYFNIQTSYIFFGYSWALFILSTLPVGRHVKIPAQRGYIEYFFNGLSSAFLFIGFIVAVEYYKYPAINTIYNNYQQLCSTAIVYALILSIWCYLRSKFVAQHLWNPYAQSGCFLADYFIGREVNPLWLHLLSIKLVHYRLALITTLVFNCIFVYKTLIFAPWPTENGKVVLSAVELALYTYQHVEFDPVALLTASLLIVYILDLLIFEHHLTSSFELQGEGVGALVLLRYAVFPYLNSLIAKYTLEHKILTYPTWALPLMGAIFIAGIFLKRASNKIKYNYRLNPSNPKFAGLETLITYQGRRLIVSSYWGIVRQPNYLGDIISNLALLMPLIWQFAWPPFIAIVYTIVLLVHRAKRVNARNYNRYNSSWRQYCTRVKYMLIPRIY